GLNAAKVARSRRWPRIPLDLGAVHDASGGRIERVPAMHGAAIVPQDEITHGPADSPSQFPAAGKGPKPVEQGFGFRESKAFDIGIAAAAEIKTFALRFRMRANQGVNHARRHARIILGLNALPQITATVIRGVVLDPQVLDLSLQ